MHSFKYSLFLLLIVFLYMGCGKPPIYDPEPTVDFLQYTNDTVLQFSDTTNLIISFTDGDGDLGTDPDITPGQDSQVELIDTRRGDTSFYTIPYIELQGAANSIRGSIGLRLAQICCIKEGFPIACSEVPGEYDEVVYQVRIMDRSGNWSDPVLTAPLVVQCFN